MELLFFENFQLHVHLTVLADTFLFFVSDTLNNAFKVEILLGEVVPVGGDPFGGLEMALVVKDIVGLFDEFFFFPCFVGLFLELLQFFLVLNLFLLEVALVLLVFIEKFSVVEFEVLFAEDQMEVVDDPLFVEQHEIVLYSLQLEILLVLAHFQVLLDLHQLLAD